VRYLILALIVLGLLAAGVAYESQNASSTRVPAIELRPSEPPQTGRQSDGTKRGTGRDGPSSGATRERSGSGGSGAAPVPAPSPIPAGDDDDGDDDDGDDDDGGGDD
jgi:hypothetical protein